MGWCPLCPQPPSLPPALPPDRLRKLRRARLLVTMHPTPQRPPPTPDRLLELVARYGEICECIPSAARLRELSASYREPPSLSINGYSDGTAAEQLLELTDGFMRPPKQAITTNKRCIAGAPLASSSEPATVELASSSIPLAVEIDSTFVPLAVELASSSTPLPVELASSSTPLPVELASSSTPLPVELASSSTPLPVELASSSTPLPVELASSSTPLPVELASSSTSLPVELASSSTRVPVELASASIPLAVELASSVPLAVELASSTPLSVERPNNGLPPPERAEVAVRANCDLQTATEPPAVEASEGARSAASSAAPAGKAALAEGGDATIASQSSITGALDTGAGLHVNGAMPALHLSERGDAPAEMGTGSAAAQEAHTPPPPQHSLLGLQLQRWVKCCIPPQVPRPSEPQPPLKDVESDPLQLPTPTVDTEDIVEASAPAPSKVTVDMIPRMGPALVLKTMEDAESFGDVTLMIAACKQLALLCKKEEGCAVCTRLHAAKAVRKTMARHLKVAELQQHACGVFVRLCGGKDGTRRDQAASSGVFRSILAAMTMHLEDRRIQETGLLAIRNICVGKDSNTMLRKKKAVEEGAIKGIVAGIRRFEGNKPVLKQGLPTLRLLCGNSQALQRQAIEQGAQEEWFDSSSPLQRLLTRRKAKRKVKSKSAG
ncbi:hypothetical protein AB1Y20_021056 [Prymnesium parvum]|uniref:Uncharacterized protein n=1 Tax=Prymnesium parvum TaxID=97485 RepID=A0AB34JIJ4_PRYPA